MVRWKQPLAWLRGLVAAFISGGAGAFTAGPIAALLAPEQFNLKNTAGMHGLMYLMGSIFLTQGMVGAFLYLSKSPLPELEMNGNGTKFITKPKDES